MVVAGLSWHYDGHGAAVHPYGPTGALAMDKDERVDLRAQIDLLKQEHRELDAAIADLASGPPLDLLRVQRLKKRKLMLKDEIVRLQDLLLPDIIA